MIDLYSLATRALHVLDPEDAHTLAIEALKLGLGPKSPKDDPILACALVPDGDVPGLKLPNPIGLAPGFDKNAEVFAPMLRAGFGFVECGTVTPLAQAGNPRPRLFRLTEDRAVINRMGFNNDGLEAFAGRLARRGPSGVIGANIGANKESEDRIGDYVTALSRVWGLCDYYTVNISSPNTPGLRALQTRTALEELLGRIVEAGGKLPDAGGRPIFLKVAPDLDDTEIEAIAEVVDLNGFNGIIVSNTTISRPDLKSKHRAETGGLSGAPLRSLSTAVLRRFRQVAAKDLRLIGAGGVATGADAYAKIRAGACAVQLYSALAFEGPSLVVRIKRELAQMLRADGFRSISDAIGAE